MKKIVSVFLLATVAGITLAIPPASSQERQAEVTQKDAENAARSVARYCKILVTRMDGIIEDNLSPVKNSDDIDLACAFADLK